MFYIERAYGTATHNFGDTYLFILIVALFALNGTKQRKEKCPQNYN